MALSLQSLQPGNFQPIVAPDPLKKYKTLADIQATQQEAQLRAAQIQEVNVNISEHKKAMEDAAKVEEILRQPGAIDEAGNVHPDAIKAIMPINSNFATALQDAGRTRAFDNAKAMEGQVAPEITAAGPQVQQAPIATSLDPNNPQMSAPAPAPAPSQQVPLPLPAVQVPGGPTLQPNSWQVLNNRWKAKEDYTKQAEADARIREKTAEQQGNLLEMPIDIPELGITKGQRVPKDWGDNLISMAAELRKPKNPTQAKTVTTEQGVFVLNPDGTLGNRLGDRPKPAPFSSTTGDDVKDTAMGIAEGKISPKISQSVSFRDRTAVSAELKRLGYDQAGAERDWNAVNKHLSTLNGAQQERLRQAITFVDETLPQVEAAYQEWKKQAGISGFKILNRATQKTMEQLPGAAGSAAHQLNALIADFTSELGTVYKGGNSSTDESLKLAATNLKADWNEQTFDDALKRLRQSVKIRKNSILTSETAGISDSVYEPNKQEKGSGLTTGVRNGTIWVKDATGWHDTGKKP